MSDIAPKGTKNVVIGLLIFNFIFVVILAINVMESPLGKLGVIALFGSIIGFMLSKVIATDPKDFKITKGCMHSSSLFEQQANNQIHDFKYDHYTNTTTSETTNYYTNPLYSNMPGNIFNHDR